jgi:hypothetical protein
MKCTSLALEREWNTTTLKKPSTANCQKDLVAKWAFVERMDFFPAELLVFVGKLRGSVSLFL